MNLILNRIQPTLVVENHITGIMYQRAWIHLVLALVLCDKIEVTVKQGRLQGTRQATLFKGRTYFAFYAVPYAQRPIRQLRFKDPKPMRKWKNIFDATLEYHGACAQAHIVHRDRLFGVEDCLRMNIFTPQIPKDQNSTLRAVVVWIHGYNFMSSLSQLHGGDFFIDNNVLLVTVSHRIGVFGFLKLKDEDSHANMGLKDIVMALKWIRLNINKFGGDKKRITLMGSNSAASLITLLLMTEARKYFSKVILQSGSIFSPSLFHGDYKLERERLIKALEENKLKLFNADTEAMIRASQKIYTRQELLDLQRPIVPFTPVVEKPSNQSLLTISPNEFIDSLKNIKKPILIGFNSQESIPEVTPFIQNPYYLRLFTKFFRFMVPFSDGCKYNSTSRVYKLVSEEIKMRYFRTQISEKSFDSFVRYTSDLMVYPILKLIKIYTELNTGKLYMYKFDYRGSLNAVKATSIGSATTKVKGVAGGDEICYVLKCEPLWENYVAMNRDKDNRDIKFIKEVTKLWTNFVKYGNPTPVDYNGNVTWLPKKARNSNNLLLIRQSLKMITSNEDDKAFEFWNGLYEKYYKNQICSQKHDEL